MNLCDQHAAKALRYLDGALRGQELEDFRAHLEICANCSENLEAEQALSGLLRRSRPLYSAPPALRSRLSTVIAERAAATPSRSRAGLYDRVPQTLRLGLAGLARPFSRPRAFVPALLLLAVFLILVPNVVRHVRAESYVQAAMASHRSSLDGRLPPEFRSSSPESVTAWFADKVPFPFRLPNSGSVPDSTPAYQLIGARVVSYRGNPDALVTYQKQAEKISLLVAPSDSAVVAGGDTIRSGSLVFHYRTDQGFKVVTWSTHGLSYALVSSVSGSARESCLVCHQDMADHYQFRSSR